MKALALRFLAATAIATAAVSAASAADLPMRAAPPPVPYIAAAPIFTWTGLYVGVNAGYGWNNDADDVVFGGTTIIGDSDNDGGFVGGAQIGYNYQIGSFVVGLEADIQYADFGSVTYTFPSPIGAVEADPEDWFGTVRARAGVAFGQTLIYATGGFAFADDRSGWVVGGGLEYAFTNNLSAKIEGLYVNLDDNEFEAGGLTYSTGDSDFGVVRAGLNFRFNTF